MPSTVGPRRPGASGLPRSPDRGTGALFVRSATLAVAAAVALAAGAAVDARAGPLPAAPTSAPPHADPTETRPFVRINVIGDDDRGSLLALGPRLGLSGAEIARIRAVSGYVGCLSPSPSAGSAALFLDDRHILTAAHILIEPSGRRRTKCFFKNQAPDPVMIDLLTETGAVFGGRDPEAGSARDWVVVALARPLADAAPLPVAVETPAAAGDRLVVVTAHPADLARDVDLGTPVVQGCTVRRVIAPQAAGDGGFLRTDCDATGSSSGGMNLARVDGRLTLRGITVTTGPWRVERFKGAPYDERRGSFTTALAVGPAMIAARDGRAPPEAAGPSAAARKAPAKPAAVPLPPQRPR